MTDENLVEIYVAANASEAQQLRAALEVAGISARVIGDESQRPPRESPSVDARGPGIWVSEPDSATAMRLLDEWIARQDAEEDEAESRGIAFGESGADSDIDSSDLQSSAEEIQNSYTPVAKALILAGVICIFLGIYFASKNYLTERALTEQIDAHFDRMEEESIIERGSPDQASKFRVLHYASYVFKVDGKKYFVAIQQPSAESDHPPVVTVRYNPRNPSQNAIPPLASPWLPLMLGACIGTALVFAVSRLE